MFFGFEIVSWILDKLWNFVLNCILLPIAVFGLCLDKLRNIVRKVSLIGTSYSIFFKLLDV